MKEIKYGEWTVYPRLSEVPQIARVANAIWQTMPTKYEGDVLYFKLWNFWVRAGVQANVQNNFFFRDYEAANRDTDALLAAIGFPWQKAETEEEVWNRIGMLWNWLTAHVEASRAADTLSSVPNTWPSILDYAKYYVSHEHLVWAACFSKAHLFATLLGRIVYPRFRFGIAEAHHTEGGAPPTATHVFVGIYVGDRWFYFDPTTIPYQNFPDFAHRTSIGVFATVDYEHPYAFIPVPLSEFNHVPYLPG